MKWIKRNWIVIIITFLTVYTLFSTKILHDGNNFTYYKLMDEIFIDLLRRKIENTNFTQVIIILGINYIIFYYIITLMLDFSKGVKDLIQYTSDTLFNFNLKIFKLIVMQYLKNFIIFIIITFILYIFLFHRNISLNDVQFILLWTICDICIFYFIQRFNNVESGTVFLISIYILMRKYIFKLWFILIIVIILHWIYDKYRKEN